MQSSTQKRRLEILEIVRKAGVQSQEDLLNLLRRKGFRVTQPTLSRDVRALGLVKTPAGWIAPEALASGVAPATPRDREQRLLRTLRESALTAVHAGQLVVIKTPPGSAQRVARAFDEFPPPSSVGTVGGDDTLFVAMRSAAAAEKLTRRIRAALERRRVAPA